MDILENIGLNEEILSTGTILEGGGFYFNERQLGSVGWQLPATTRYPFPFVNPQPECEAAFEHVLNQRGFEVERGNEVISLDVLNDYVEVNIKDSRTIKARYVVGCDGAHSLVRHSQRNWKFEGRPVNLLFAQCDGTIADQRIPTTRAGFFVSKAGRSKKLGANARIFLSISAASSRQTV
jgi:2-polyprenyl-6-methoxyphenol hydroxylase-like FAD-dependent oxidoreductase